MLVRAPPACAPRNVAPTRMVAPALWAWAAAYLSSALRSTSSTPPASTVMEWPPGATSTAVVIAFPAMSTDGTMPSLSNALLLSMPPQCCGVPISWSCSSTSTECPTAATSRAQSRPAMLPPATTTSYSIPQRHTA